MKFAKELDRELVPAPPPWPITAPNAPLSRPAEPAASEGSGENDDDDDDEVSPGSTPRARPISRPAPTRRPTESDFLTDSTSREMHYGSFVPTPGYMSPSVVEESYPFELPAPALKESLKHSDSVVEEGGRKWGRRGPLATASTWSASCCAAAPPAPQRAGRSPADISMQNLDLVREKQHEFHEFLDTELEKVEKFYRFKEDQAGKRLALLREQLHEMRNRRIQEMSQARAKNKPAKAQSRKHNKLGGSEDEAQDEAKDLLSGFGHANWVKPFTDKILGPGPNSKALQRWPRPRADARRDYIRRPDDRAVPYRSAKRKLKLALQEFYRSLELLKSYALLNRTAFRKLNKKYDKAVHARPPYRYLNDKVNPSYFVTSDVLEGYIQVVEDLAFRNGLLLGTGIVFSIQGLTFGARLLTGADTDFTLRQQTSYLMQIYGGYFLMLLLFIMFCIDCRFWHKNKINYHFIFEFDPRHQLDWKQLSEFPSFFTFLFGMFMWLNFSQYGSEDMYLYYPVVLIGISALIIFMPLRVFMVRSRNWFVYSHNIELFFCLYANHWENPVQCNSNNSRLLGFFAALPPIWRFLQCLRRYHDTKNIFPHLVNGGKYTMSIAAAVTLSLYRISPSKSTLAAFITFSIINSIYCSIWDLFMDFSLLQPRAHSWLLRDITALKSRWIYYVIMVLDPILRFSWIAIAIFTHNTQHSTVVSFSVSLFEVLRRGMWALIRVENEHCANVAQYKASRDVPLPYRFETASDEDTVHGGSPAAAAAATPLVQGSQGGAPAATTTTATRPRPPAATKRPPPAASAPRKTDVDVPVVDEEEEDDEDEQTDEEDEDGEGMVSRGSSGLENGGSSSGGR
ncbi:unnamed protein product [Parascedosporium putredinis]|uniref:EXS-domain-containing protein n=1 Tax=Parascedosporium putredinis TaxID=1442378 RepID=A0A9P1GZ41_9PEZI|nr:unnamed protein product [Parascedosporium putredinis]CAI7990713.1 unnamed protein product [Parascedosporium putredinis]